MPKSTHKKANSSPKKDYRIILYYPDYPESKKGLFYIILIIILTIIVIIINIFVKECITAFTSIMLKVLKISIIKVHDIKF